MECKKDFLEFDDKKFSISYLIKNNVYSFRYYDLKKILNLNHNVIKGIRYCTLCIPEELIQDSSSRQYFFGNKDIFYLKKN